MKFHVASSYSIVQKISEFWPSMSNMTNAALAECVHMHCCFAAVVWKMPSVLIRHHQGHVDCRNIVEDLLKDCYDWVSTFFYEHLKNSSLQLEVILNNSSLIEQVQKIWSWGCMWILKHILLSWHLPGLQHDTSQCRSPVRMPDAPDPPDTCRPLAATP